MGCVVSSDAWDCAAHVWKPPAGRVTSAAVPALATHGTHRSLNWEQSLSAANLPCSRWKPLRQRGWHKTSEEEARHTSWRVRAEKARKKKFLRVNLNFRALFGGEAYIRRKVSKSMMGCRQNYFGRSTMMEQMMIGSVPALRYQLNRTRESRFLNKKSCRKALLLSCSNS